MDVKIVDTQEEKDRRWDFFLAMHLPLGERLCWFRDYWLLPFVIVMATAAFTAVLLHSMLFTTLPDMSVICVLPSSIDTDALSSGLERSLDTDESNVEDVDAEFLGSGEALTSTVLPTRFAAGDFNFLIGDEETVRQYAKRGMFVPLEEAVSSKEGEKTEADKELQKLIRESKNVMRVSVTSSDVNGGHFMKKKERAYAVRVVKGSGLLGRLLTKELSSEPVYIAVTVHGGGYEDDAAALETMVIKGE